MISLNYYIRGSNPMAMNYGTPIKPYAEDEKRINEMVDHTGWSKSQVVQHMVAKTYDLVMSGTKAPKPGSD
jgi:hypothetical protein